MRKHLFLFFIVLTFFGCAIGPKYTWNSNPQMRTASNDYFDVSLLPVLGQWGGYESFQLIIKNTTDKELELDWNKTMYISSGNTNGGFMFEGVVYKDRNNSKPNDIIFAKSTFSKRIWPNNLVTFYRRWGHSPMSNGENGVYLSVNVEGKEVKEKMTVTLNRVSSSQ